MTSERGNRRPERSTGDQIFALIPIALFILFFYLLYRIMSPFLGSIAWAAILGILFAPVHRRLLRGLRNRRRWQPVRAAAVREDGQSRRT